MHLCNYEYMFAYWQYYIHTYAQKETIMLKVLFKNILKVMPQHGIPTNVKIFKFLPNPYGRCGQYTWGRKDNSVTCGINKTKMQNIEEREEIYEKVKKPGS